MQLINEYYSKMAKIIHVWRNYNCTMHQETATLISVHKVNVARLSKKFKVAVLPDHDFETDANGDVIFCVFLGVEFQLAFNHVERYDLERHKYMRDNVGQIFKIEERTN